VAVKAALKRMKGTWFGWSGRIAPPSKAKPRTIKRDNITYIVSDLTEEDHKEYYNGFANRVLWPILHYQLDRAEFTHRDLSGYLRVNDSFARQLHELLKPDDLVWVHDYHLMPLAKALRERGHKNRIGFFLHIPCPPPEIITALPHHDQLLPALCEYDLVGFQTGDDAFNFSRYLARECGLASRDFNFPLGERSMRIDVFPVGIETAGFAKLAQRSASSTFVQHVRESLSGRVQIIGVDRLDYTKGLHLRMHAFDRFLTTQPQWRGKVTYLQISPKSRSDIREYSDMARQIEAAARRLHRTLAGAGRAAHRHVHRRPNPVPLARPSCPSRAPLGAP